MTDAPKRIWVCPDDNFVLAAPSEHPVFSDADEYILATEVEAMIGEAEKRAEEKWFADARLMLGFADLAYAAGAKPSSSELLAAEQRVLERVRRDARVEGMRAALEAVLARYMGDNNREDAEVLRCCDTIRALIDKETGQ